MVQTVGTITASVVNPQVQPSSHLYNGSPNRLFMVLDENGGLMVHTGETLEGDHRKFNGIILRVASVIIDGQLHTYALENPNTSYWGYEPGVGVRTYWVTTGSITCSLNQSAEMKGTFHFEAAFEGKEVKISNGVVNLSGYASVADLEF
jgi:hypothetical protein